MIASLSPGVIPWTLTGALALAGLAAIVAAVRILRTGDAGDVCDEPEVSNNLVTPASLILFTANDVSKHVRSLMPGESKELVAKVAYFITWHLDAPELGQDWGPWLAENFDRLKQEAFDEYGREGYLKVTGGGS